IMGGGGNDLLGGNLGDDFLDAGAGDDMALGDGSRYAGDVQAFNSFEGPDGNDTVLGGDGNDLLDGGMGKDSVVSGAGDDIAANGENDDPAAHHVVLSANGTLTVSGREVADQIFVVQTMPD